MMPSCSLSAAAPPKLRLSTERLLLRELEESDWPVIHAYASLPEARRYMLAGQGTRDRTRSFVLSSMAAAQANPRIFYAFGIVLRAENRLVGTIVLRAGNADRGAQVGWDVNRAYWNRGIATEAARSVLAFAFADLGVRAVHADSFARNFASIRVMEKLGMQRLTRGWFASMRLAERYGEWRPMIRYVVRPQRHTANVAQAPY